MQMVENVRLYYGAGHALRGVSSAARKGRVICVRAAATASARPRFLRAILGLEPVRSGRSGPGKSAHGLCRGATRPARGPEEVYELFPILKDMLRRRGGDLSGGQQPQLANALALVMRPRPLLLDEPTEGIAGAKGEIDEVVVRRYLTV